MKKILLSIFAFAVIGITAKVQAQCTIAQSSIIVNIKSVTANGLGGCTTVFDLTYDIANNGGNKWSYLHFWDATAYAGISYPNGPGPKKTELNGGVGFPDPLLTTVAIDYVDGSPAIAGYYGPDNSNIFPQTTGGITVTRTVVTGGERFTITNISVASTNCNPLNLLADVWSAQDDNGKNVACGITGLQIRADEPLVRGLLLCSTPRSYTVSIQTKTNRDVTWTAYRDVAPLGVFDANDQLPANVVDGPRTEPNDGNPDGVTYDVHGPYNLPGGPGSQYNVWVVVTATGVSNSNSFLIVNTCAALPASLVSFTAKRTGTNVVLNWQTATESNNTGFAIERNVNGNWEVVSFVASKAVGGNSESMLSYSYAEFNNVKGITQYRLRQVDFDGKSKLSEIRSVRSDDQPVKLTVYPNPSIDGKVNVMFDDAKAIRNISVLDMSGRTVRQFNNVSNNNITIENLTPGIYTIRVSVPETGEQSVQKVIVSKH